MRAVTNIGYCPQGFVRFLAVDLECLVWMSIREEMKQESESLRISLRLLVVWRRTPYGFPNGQQIRK